MPKRLPFFVMLFLAVAAFTAIAFTNGPHLTNWPINAKALASYNQSTVKPLAQILKEKGLANSGRGIKIVIDKSDHSLSIFSGNNWLKSYPVEFGEGGTGDKEVAGDRKTPEGTFYVTEKSVLNPADYYLGSRWLRLSYPNTEDADRGLLRGLINRWTRDQVVAAIRSGTTPPQHTALGGGVGIHGGDKPEFGNSWTWGCIGLSNTDIEDFYNVINLGTPVIIKK